MIQFSIFYHLKAYAFKIWQSFFVDLYIHHHPFANSQEFQVQTNLPSIELLEDGVGPSHSSRHYAYVSPNEKSQLFMSNEACDTKTKMAINDLSNATFFNHMGKKKVVLDKLLIFIFLKCEEVSR